jgi:glycolate oxidase iron-sulfur subunit
MGGSMNKSVSTSDVNGCMKCGFCMSNCPVYAVDHIESHVARGRNMLVKQVNESNADMSAAYGDRLSYCLLCGRCEAVCPAKVLSSDINVAARTEVVAKKGLPWINRIAYQGILKNRKLMASLLGFVSMFPGISIKNGTPMRHMAESVMMLSKKMAVPKLSKPFLSRRTADLTRPGAGIPVKGKVAIFPGCAFEFFFADTGEHIIKDLVNAGYEVAYPRDLTCCGLAVRSAGDLKTAQEMAMKNIAALEQYDTVITGCATCGSTLKDYGRWFDETDQRRLKAKKLSSKIKDLSEFLAENGMEASTSDKVVVTYHDPCHMRWRQGIKEQPRKLLRAIPGVEFVEMEGADECCGLGGSFSLSHRDISLEIQKKKMESVRKTGADVVVTSCPGCLVQLKDGALRHGVDVEVMHISQLIGGQKVQPRKRPSAGDAAAQ